MYILKGRCQKHYRFGNGKELDPFKELFWERKKYIC